MAGKVSAHVRKGARQPRAIDSLFLFGEGRVRSTSRVAGSLLVTAIAAAAIVAAAFWPIWRMYTMVFQTGEATASDDFPIYTDLLGRILQGHYNWLNYFHDSFVIGSQSEAVLLLIRLAVIKLSHWDMYTELGIGFAFAFLKLALIYAAFTRSANGRTRWLLLPVLAALVFSPSQINTFGYVDASLTTTLPQAAMAFAAWALFRSSRRAWQVATAALLGVLATWTGGDGLAFWPAFLVGLLLSQHRTVRAFFWYAAACAVSIMPYTYYTAVHPIHWLRMWNLLGLHQAHRTILNPAMIIVGLGLPLASRVSGFGAAGAGLLGIFLLVCGAILVRHLRGDVLRTTGPGIMIVVYGVVEAWLVGTSRTQPTPWYAGHFIYFWIGITGIAYALLVHERSRPSMRIWGVATLACTCLLYLLTNMSFGGKIYYLYYHSASSAACLRAYRTAPTYCEQRLGGWKPGTAWPFDVQMAHMLQKYQLSVFSPDETWTLQGDFALPSVTARESDRDALFWAEGPQQPAIPYSDYRRLDLFLRGDNRIDWRISVPPGVTAATLTSAVRLPSRHGSRTFAYVRILPPEGLAPATWHSAVASGAWNPVTIDLSRFKGESLIVEIGAALGHADRRLVEYRYPTIRVHIRSTDTAISLAAPRPSGRPLVPSRMFENPEHAVDARLVEQGPGAATWQVGPHAYLEYAPTTPLCLSMYSYLTFRASAASNVWPRTSRVTLEVITAHQSRPTHLSFYMPLLTDDRMHLYAYDLKLLSLRRNSVLRKVQIAPLWGAPARGATDVQVGNVGIVRAVTGEACSPSASA